MSAMPFYCPECEAAGHRRYLAATLNGYKCAVCDRSYTSEELRTLYEEDYSTLMTDAEWIQKTLLAALPVADDEAA